MKKLLLYMLVYTLGIGFSNAQTSIPGGTVSGTWTLAGSPYLIQGNITIPDSQTLTIMPGVRVEFNGTCLLKVKGRLLAIGTVTDTIIWTTKDTFNGWRAIRFDKTPNTNDTSKLIYCKLELSQARDTFPYYNGGALYIDSYSKIIISHTNISNCSSYDGGGIYCNNQSNPIITYNTIANNVSTDKGGGIFLSNSCSPVISNNTISNNSAASGGGIYSVKYCTPTISNNTIIKNSVIGSGGGISCWDDSSPNIFSNTISNNTAGRGGGIFCINNVPTIINNTITNNTATNDGGGICIQLSNPTITNNTIANNHAVRGGALSFQSYASPTLLNTILYGNTASLNGQQVYLTDDHSDPNFYYCDVQGGTAQFANGFGIYKGIFQFNIDTIPLFTAPSDSSGTAFNGIIADWSLQSGSPCIDSGDPSGTYPATDKAGKQRVVNIIDIGAYELQTNRYFGGKVYYDVNSNSKKDAGEPGISGNLIETYPGPHYTCSDKNGSFINYIDTGNITISQVTNNGIYKYWHLSPGNPVQYNIHVADNIIDMNNNFGMIPTPNVKDLRIFLTSQTSFMARPGYTEYYSIVYENIGTATISSGSVNFTLDSRVNLQTANPNYTTYTKPNASWSFSNLLPTEKRTIDLTIKIDSTLSINDSIRYMASISPTTGDSDITNNYDTLKQYIVTAIDPNDKQCSPEGSILAQTSKIDYTIRFQNTGNHIAYRVRVIDTISDNLPMTKILLKTSSHPYELQVRDNVLIWTFNNIMLPDSTTDEPHSHGYISYAAFIKSGLAIGTQITNKAYIYFDYQLPIATKSTLNVITKLDDIEEERSISNNFDYLVYPNPAIDKIYILYNGKNQKQDLIILNSLGQRISSIRILAGEKRTIDVSHLPTGLYLLKDNKGGFIKKIIVGI